MAVPRPPSWTAPPRFRLALAALVALSLLVLVAQLARDGDADRATTLRQAAADRLAQLSHYLPSARDSDPLAYRRFLEHTAAPPRSGSAAANSTRAAITDDDDRETERGPLGFSHVYVLSLPSRTDRRRDMRRIAHALDIDIEFVDAANKDEPFIKWIAERVAESRELRRDEMAKARGVPRSRIGGLKIGSDWVTPFPGNVSAWTSSTALPPTFPPFPAYEAAPSLAKGTRKQNWVQHLESLHSAGGRHTSLRPSRADLDVAALLFDKREHLAVRQVHEGIISTFWGQTRALKRVLENGDRTALILEDDVDVEWDVARLWASIERRLPRDAATGEPEWDVAFLGHCWGGEYQKPQYLHPLVHRSTGPMCLHGYAVTSRGARRLLAHLLSPWSAFSSAVDLVIPTLLHVQDELPAALARAHPHPLASSFSIVPPLVVQRKDGPSDLQTGTGSPWRGVLRDSTVERIKRDDGSWTDDWDDKYVPGRIDPATQIRCGPV
ncbi:uncharacterized protein JCM10292_000316 [Rhodotorula paludigena]|uniref:uncharacterized protein n=1 Tax=Rhodotorula paludigena TaxID=86838 RepID=UPI003177A741